MNPVCTHPTTHTLGQHSTQDRALQHIIALMAQPTFLTDNIKRITALAAIVNTSTTLTATRDTSNNHRIFNCLSWTGLPLDKEANFHHLTQGVWSPILAEKTAIGREQIIKQWLVGPLRLQHPELVNRLTPDWIKSTQNLISPQLPNNKLPLWNGGHWQ